MTKGADYSEIITRLKDLKNQSERWQKHRESFFLTEEEQAAAARFFPPSSFIRYDGGYEGAQRKKVIFTPDEEDDFSDIVCLRTSVSLQFRTIGHRDILGTLMALQIERNALGDFWLEDQTIYLYTSEQMGRFIIDQCTRIGGVSVSFEMIDEHPVRIRKQARLEQVIASNRLDAIVAALAKISRSQAKELIRSGKVQLDHVVLEEPDKICNNNCTISIRGVGRFVYVQTLRKTRKDREIAEFLQDL